MQFPWLPILPLLHVLALMGFVAALVHMKKHMVVGGVLAFLALLCVLATASFFLFLYRAGI